MLRWVPAWSWLESSHIAESLVDILSLASIWPTTSYCSLPLSNDQHIWLRWAYCRIRLRPFLRLYSLIFVIMCPPYLQFPHIGHLETRAAVEFCLPSIVDWSLGAALTVELLSRSRRWSFSTHRYDEKECVTGTWLFIYIVQMRLLQKAFGVSLKYSWMNCSLPELNTSH